VLIPGIKLSETNIKVSVLQFLKFCARMRAVLDTLVDGSPYAFISGRELVHNAVLCEQLARGCNREHPALYVS